jgi:hypothetical protein
MLQLYRAREGARQLHEMAASHRAYRIACHQTYTTHTVIESSAAATKGPLGVTCSRQSWHPMT